jgi:hypothetical protein
MSFAPVEATVRLLLQGENRMTFSPRRIIEFDPAEANPYGCCYTCRAALLNLILRKQL